MRTSGTPFTDWEQVDADRRRPLLVDEDFSWSEPPSRRRRSVALDASPWRERRVEPEYEVESEYAHEALSLDLEREVDMAWGGRMSASLDDSYEVVPYSFSGDVETDPGARRTVVITGRGAGYYPAPSRRRAETGLAFHERAGFNPDRMAMWAVLLGVALLLGCIAH
jgi:hypothetical protein